MDKVDFISNTRNSLTVITGLVKLIKKRSEQKDISEFCEIISEEAQKIINDIQNFFFEKRT